VAQAKTQQKSSEPKTELEKPDPKAAEPIGRIDTTAGRPTWEIDGKFYELRQLTDYGIAAQQRLNRDGREFYQLWTSDDELTDDQGKRLKFLLERMFNGDALVAQLLDAPKGLVRKLNDGDKADVVLSFTLAPLRKAMAAAAQTEQPETETQADEARVSESISTS
jgi:hypothetical protein